MRTILITASVLALSGCAANHLYLGSDSDTRLTCGASVSLKLHGIKLGCGSQIRPNDYLRPEMDRSSDQTDDPSDPADNQVIASSMPTLICSMVAYQTGDREDTQEALQPEDDHCKVVRQQGPDDSELLDMSLQSATVA